MRARWRQQRPWRRGVAAAAGLYLVSFLAPLLHFALIPHTLDPHSGRPVGLTGHRSAAAAADPAAGAERLRAVAGAHHRHGHCCFADHLNGHSALQAPLSGAPHRLARDPAPRGADTGPLHIHDALGLAPKHSPPAPHG